MALTQVSSEGIKDAQVKTADILDANITTAKVADNAITGAKVADNLDIPDSNKIRFGTGNDSEFVHDGTNTKWVTTNGNIRLLDDAIEFWNRAGNEPIAKFDANGSCELYHDDSKKFETTSAGISVSACNVTGHINLSDTSRIYLGNDNDSPFTNIDCLFSLFTKISISFGSIIFISIL